MSEDRVWYPGRCHCGGVRFAAQAGRRPTVTLCNCSIHEMSGFQELMVPDERFRLEHGRELLREYRYGARVADHTFCTVCGIKPFNRPRSHPSGYVSVNVRCLDLSAADEVSYVEFDGVNWEQSIAAGTHVRSD